jgi:hypothetical protein
MKTGIEQIPEELWQMAGAREAVIRPLAAFFVTSGERKSKPLARVPIE